MSTEIRFESDPSGIVKKLVAPAGTEVNETANEAALAQADALATIVIEFHSDWQEGDFTLSPAAANAVQFMNQAAVNYNAQRQG